MRAPYKILLSHICHPSHQFPELSTKSTERMTQEMWGQLRSRAAAPSPSPALPEAVATRPTGLPGRTWMVSFCCQNRSLKEKIGGLLGCYWLQIHLPAFLFLNDLRKLEMCHISFGRNMSEQKLLREFSLISGMHRARNLLWLRLLLVKSGLQHPVGLYSVLGTEWVLLSEVRTATPWEQLYGSCLHLPRGDHEAQ